MVLSRRRKFGYSVILLLVIVALVLTSIGTIGWILSIVILLAVLFGSFSHFGGDKK